ncbi:MAG: sigma-54 dependent transcriptional regulator [Gemmatimonadaceae bacterium]
MTVVRLAAVRFRTRRAPVFTDSAVPTVLIVDDEPNIRRMIGALLQGEGYDIRDAPDGVGGVARARDGEADVVLLDLMMPGALDGLATLARLREDIPDVPVIMMSGQAALADAVKATKLGAFNFLEKPVSPEGVLVAVRAALELTRSRRETRALRADLGLSGHMIGESPSMNAVRALIAKVAPTDARVLVTGESGTGKELVAAAIHEGSPRRNNPLIRVNCAAIPRDLVESEMFGHEKGAFTGATQRRVGRFELAHTGTLFLDEVGDLGAEAQAKLLRAIEAKEIERLGGGKPIRVDLRIVSATNKDLVTASLAGAFRDDLLFRLNVIPIALPPLRERPGDIPALVRHFSAFYRARTGRPAAEWTNDVLTLLGQYRWPGNVRELANIVERLAILREGAEVRANDVHAVLPIPSHGGVAIMKHLPDPSLPESLTATLDEYERTLIVRALSAAAGNVAAAARGLQTDRPNLYRRMKRLGIAGFPD